MYVLIGDYIILTMARAPRYWNRDSYGMKCDPTSGCVPVPCQESSCISASSIFQIMKAKNNDGDSMIRSSDKVSLRSTDYKSYFLNCSKSTKCLLSQCGRSPLLRPSLCLKYRSSCTDYVFIILGTTKKNEPLRTNQIVVFRKQSIETPVTYASILCTKRNCYLQSNERDCKFKNFKYSKHCVEHLFKLTKVFIS